MSIFNRSALVIVGAMFSFFGAYKNATGSVTIPEKATWPMMVASK